MNHEQNILHLKFVRFGANAKEWMRRCVLLLPDIEKHRIWEKKGFGSIYEYAAKLAGMSRQSVDDTLRILRRIADKPELQKVVEHKGLNAVRPVASIATPETAEFWAEKAEVMSKHTLETYVREFQQNTRTGTENNAENSQQQAILTSPPKGRPARKIVVMEVEPELLQKLEKLKGNCGWNELLQLLLKEHEEKLEKEKPEAVKTSSRHIPNKIKKYVLKRTNGHCAYPGCKKSSEILHHTQRFALEKVHDPDRLHGLCKAHERIAHHGLIEQEELSPEKWKMRENPDPNHPKHEVDRIVEKIRKRWKPL